MLASVLHIYSSTEARMTLTLTPIRTVTQTLTWTHTRTHESRKYCYYKTTELYSL